VTGLEEQEIVVKLSGGVQFPATGLSVTQGFTLVIGTVHANPLFRANNTPCVLGGLPAWLDIV
jgi:hypothetical protein